MRYEFPSPNDNASLASFEETVTKFGSNNFIYFENEKWTYNQTNKAANALANKLLMMVYNIAIEWFSLWKIDLILLLVF